jgi:hypothetical protein
MTTEKKDELKKSEEGKVEKVEEKPIEKAEEKVTEDELLKAITSLEEIVKARTKDLEEGEEEKEEKKEEEPEEKSFTGNFEEDETLEKAIEVSDFLSALVDQTENSITALGATVARLEKSMSNFDTGQITALKEVGTKLDSLSKRLEVIENTPVRGAKSIVKSAQVIEKSFATDERSGIDALPKRKVLDLMEKAVGEGKLQDSKLFAYESANIITDDTKDILKSYL